jgi:hypothetical protein
LRLAAREAVDAWRLTVVASEDSAYPADYLDALLQLEQFGMDVAEALEFARYAQAWRESHGAAVLV